MRDWLSGALDHEWPAGPLESEPPDWDLVDEAMWWLPIVATYLKPSEFEAEREWRSAIHPDYLDRREQPEYWRVRDGRLVPYVKLPLPKADDKKFWRSVRLAISPELTGTLQGTAIRRLFKSKFGVDCRISPSTVSLRAHAA